MKIATLFNAYRKTQEIKRRTRNTWLEKPHDSDLLAIYEQRCDQANHIEAELEHRIDLADRAARQRGNTYAYTYRDPRRAVLGHAP